MDIDHCRVCSCAQFISQYLYLIIRFIYLLTHFIKKFNFTLTLKDIGKMIDAKIASTLY